MTISQGNVLNNISLNSKQNLRSVPKISSKVKAVKEKSFKAMSTETQEHKQRAGYMRKDLQLKEFRIKGQTHFKNDECKKVIQEPKEQLQTQKKPVSNIHNVKESSEKKFQRASKVSSLFIGKLKPTVTEEMLKQTFKKYQSFESAKLCRDFLTKKSLGYGYLNFRNEKDVDSARKDYNYTLFFGQEVKIMPSMKNTLFRKNIGTNVFFSNLPLDNPQLTTRSFYLIMIEYGNVLSCLLEKRKNIGFVYFDNDISARNVIKKFNNQEFFGNKVICGIHFDKEVRSRPEFTKRKRMIGSDIVIEDELSIGKNLPDNAPLKTILVKNLPTETTQEEVLDFFSASGPVKSVFVSRKQGNKSPKAFVTYKNEKDSKTAQKDLDKTVFKGQTIWVGPAKDRCIHNKNGTSKKTKIYLKSLSFNCNKEFLSQVCIQERIKYSEIKITNYNSSNWTFSGYVECVSSCEAEKLFKILDRRLIGSSLVEASWTRNYDHVFDEIGYNGNDDSNIPVNTSSMMRFHYPQQQPSYQMGLPSQLLSQISPFPSYANSCTNMNSLVATPMKPHPAFDLTSSNSNEKMQPVRECKQGNEEILESLKKVIKRNLRYINISGLSKGENLRSISEFIFEVFWDHDSGRLAHFLLLTNTSPESQKSLQKQIIKAAESLGFSI
ncbi:hypothetical protein SEUBUCD646_0O01840 [Saccharomyces eubayanus]|uniref:RRM domain-containing protein n=1 Tax=Saccharomyces eubayanus TaxID=1080349 RepID=A0ABN8VSG0_SACEU|nr:hypothetical protein SEUBUCD650_0O01830 [Saccharomyces eubayanus]CAI1752134.1 hypothetical protein SEUBUCD646_0O01840 [Saccharomyces eubayanus]